MLLTQGIKNKVFWNQTSQFLKPMKAGASVKLTWDLVPMELMVNLYILNSISTKTKRIPFKIGM